MADACENHKRLVAASNRATAQQHPAERGHIHPARRAGSCSSNDLDREPSESDENAKVGWIPVDQLNDLPMDRGQCRLLDWALTQKRRRIDENGD